MPKVRVVGHAFMVVVEIIVVWFTLEGIGLVIQSLFLIWYCSLLMKRGFFFQTSIFFGKNPTQIEIMDALSVVGKGLMACL
jgi:hypothetical protein